MRCRQFCKDIKILVDEKFVDEKSLNAKTSHNFVAINSPAERPLIKFGSDSSSVKVRLRS